MKIINFISLLFLILFISSRSSSVKDKKVIVPKEEVEIYFLNQKMKFNFKDTNQDYRVYVFIKNNSNQDLILPTNIYQGVYQCNGELLIEYQKWNSKSKTFEDHPYLKSNNYTFCYDKDRKYKTIKSGKVYERYLYLNNFEMIDSVGKYRFRCHLLLPNEFNNKDFISIWQEFIVN
jgi:hypothetical protein